MSPSAPPAELPSSVGELAEFAALLQAHHERLVNIVRRRIDPPLAARIDPEAVVNTAFATAGRRWRVFMRNRRVSDFMWLYRMVIDTFLEERRKATADKRDPRREEVWGGSDDGFGRLVADGPGPATEAMRNEQARKLAEALESLSPDDRQVIHLRSTDELSHAEVGELLGVSEGAAAKRYFRALAELRGVYVRLTRESRP